MFDALVREVADRFGLGDKAGDLLAELLAIIFDPRSGGIAGFAAKLRERGLGAIFDSRSDDGAASATIEPRQVDDVLGADAVFVIAQRLGIARGTLLSAAAALLPKLIGRFTRDGSLPTGVPPEVTSYLGGFGKRLGDFGTPARSAVPAPAAAPGGAGPRWLKWLVLAALALALGYCALQRRNEVTTPPAPSSPATTQVPQAVPMDDARFDFSYKDGAVTYSSRVGSEAERDRLVEAMRAAFDPRRIGGGVVVNGNTQPAGWLSALAAILPRLAFDGMNLHIRGNAIEVGGTLADADRTRLAELLRGAFGGYAIKGLDAGMLRSASDALAALVPGKYTAADLVAALNLMTIHFETGSAAIGPDSLDVLEKAAAAIRNAPAGTHVAIGGHTDNTGDAAANLALSQARADAVRAKLIELGVTADMLTAKGYGDTRPVSDNATEEGRAKNRRMEFSVAE
jgi:outer membrane protein OmpA-like peptidoglycan-associated protein/uncharacterized protein YidB (DUF937 family)